MSEGFIKDISLLQEINEYGPSRMYLPSRGLLYGSLIPDGEVVLNPMSTKHERMMASTTQDMMFKSIIQVLYDRTEMPGMKMNDLLLSDLMFLMIVLRSISLGGDYTGEFICKSRRCGEDISKDIKLPWDLPLVELTEEDKPPFYITLPICKKTVGWRYLTVADEATVSKKVKSIMEEASHDKKDPNKVKNIIMTVRRAIAITTIDGDANASFNRRIDFVDNLIALDGQLLQDAFIRKQFGFKLDIIADCVHCGHEDSYDFEITPQFFRPKLDSSRYMGGHVPVEDDSKTESIRHKRDDTQGAGVVVEETGETCDGG